MHPSSYRRQARRLRGADLQISRAGVPKRDGAVRVSGWSVALIAVVLVLSLGTASVKNTSFGTILHGLHLGNGYMESVNGTQPISSDIRRVSIEVHNTPVTVTGTRRPR